MKNRQGAGAAWALCAGWMMVIFAFSAAPGDVSGEQSGLIVRLILFLFPWMPLQTLGVLVRKGAHMTEYAVLFWLYRRALMKSGAKRAALYAFALTVLYAATDECHQKFVPGRGPAATDVLIDATGAAAAWAAACIGRKNARTKREIKN